MIATEEKPTRKPTANPLAKSGLSLIQNNTKQKGWVFGSPTQSKNPPPRLLGIATSKVFFLGSSFLAHSVFAIAAKVNLSIQHVFHKVLHIDSSRVKQRGDGMGTYNPYFQNNVPEHVCPFCGTSRPLDWFGKELKHEIRDKRTGPRSAHYPLSQYVACWRCRGIKRITTLTDPTRLLGNDLIG